MARKLSGHFMAVDTPDDVDLTPMLDVVFILLIFFIVTASFVKEFSQPIETATANKTTAIENADIVIDISATNEVWIDQRRVDERSVRANIERLHAENPTAAVVVRANGRSNVKTYVLVADSAYAAGVESVVIMPVDSSSAI